MGLEAQVALRRMPGGSSRPFHRPRPRSPVLWTRFVDAKIPSVHALVPRIARRFAHPFCALVEVILFCHSPAAGLAADAQDHARVLAWASNLESAFEGRRFEPALSALKADPAWPRLKGFLEKAGKATQSEWYGALLHDAFRRGESLRSNASALGDFHASRGEWRRAAAYVRLLLDNDPGSGGVKPRDRLQALELGRMRAWFAEADRAEGWAPTTRSNLEARFQEANALHRGDGDFERALRALREVLALDPRHAGAFKETGFIHDKLGDYFLAIRYYERSLECDDHLMGMNNLLGAYLHVRDWEGARVLSRRMHDLALSNRSWTTNAMPNALQRALASMAVSFRASGDGDALAWLAGVIRENRCQIASNYLLLAKSVLERPPVSNTAAADRIRRTVAAEHWARSTPTRYDFYTLRVVSPSLLVSTREPRLWRIVARCHGEAQCWESLRLLWREYLATFPSETPANLWAERGLWLGSESLPPGFSNHFGTSPSQFAARFIRTSAGPTANAKPREPEAGPREAAFSTAPARSAFGILLGSTKAPSDASQGNGPVPWYPDPRGTNGVGSIGGSRFLPDTNLLLYGPPHPALAAGIRNPDFLKAPCDAGAWRVSMISMIPAQWSSVQAGLIPRSRFRWKLGDARVEATHAGNHLQEPFTTSCVTRHPGGPMILSFERLEGDAWVCGVSFEPIRE